MRPWPEGMSASIRQLLATAKGDGLQAAGRVEDVAPYRIICSYSQHICRAGRGRNNTLPGWTRIYALGGTLRELMPFAATLTEWAAEQVGGGVAEQEGQRSDI